MSELRRGFVQLLVEEGLATKSQIKEALQVQKESEKAITIGLLPDLPLDRFQFIGNSSVAGARIALVSNHAFEKAEAIAKKVGMSRILGSSRDISYTPFLVNPGRRRWSAARCQRVIGKK